MKKTNDYKKLQALGGWLELLLSDSLENWEIKRLFEEGVNLLDMQYEIPYKHPFFIDLDELTKKNDTWEPNLVFFDGNGPDFFHNESVGQMTRSELWYVIPVIRRILRSVLQIGQPWFMSIKGIMYGECDLEKNMAVSISGCEGEKQEMLICELTKRERRDDIKYLDCLYSNIGNRLIMTDDNCRRARVFLSCGEKGEIVPVLTTPSEQPLPFAIIASRIFFDFLLLGGQEYYSFCKNCGRFIVAQRKGRLQFCGGGCRIAHKRKLDRGER